MGIGTDMHLNLERVKNADDAGDVAACVAALAAIARNMESYDWFSEASISRPRARLYKCSRIQVQQNTGSVNYME